MRHAHDPAQAGPRPFRRSIAVVLAVLLAAAAGVGVWGLTRTGPSDSPLPAATTEAKRAATPSPSPDAGAGLEGSQATAWWAATVLFDWDTATTDPATVAETLLGAADPSGEETAGLASDIANYLPDQATWARLRGMAVKQRIEVASVTVPLQWERALKDAAEGQILPGTTAHTITGTRHREGVWQDQPSTFAEPVSFTVFVTCAPSFPECHVMRLSLPGQPLR